MWCPAYIGNQSILTNYQGGINDLIRAEKDASRASTLAEVERMICELFEHCEHVPKIEILKAIYAMKEGKHDKMDQEEK
jgi:hypothetical protein